MCEKFFALSNNNDWKLSSAGVQSKVQSNAGLDFLIFDFHMFLRNFVLSVFLYALCAITLSVCQFKMTVISKWSLIHKSYVKMIVILK